jgi:hypothetical protein
MTDAAYVIAGWSITALAMGAYAVSVQRRLRRAVRSLPPEERPPWA